MLPSRSPDWPWYAPGEAPHDDAPEARRGQRSARPKEPVDGIQKVQRRYLPASAAKIEGRWRPVELPGAGRGWHYLVNHTRTYSKTSRGNKCSCGSFPPNAEPPEVSEPLDRTFHGPPSSVTPQRTAVLGLVLQASVKRNLQSILIVPSGFKKARTLPCGMDNPGCQWPRTEEVFSSVKDLHDRASCGAARLSTILSPRLRHPSRLR